MRHEKQVLIRRWLEWNVGHDRQHWQTPTHLMGPIRGLEFRGSTIYEGDGSTRLAEYERRSVGPKGAVRLVLPNQLTMNRHQMIRQVVERAGIPVMMIPRAVIDQADIERDTIRIIDTLEPEEPFRAAEQLIHAHVRTYVGYRTPVRDMLGRIRYGTPYAERDAYFLSGFDRNERRLSYFFCELPPESEPTTVTEAYEVLKPGSVLAAEAQGLMVRRQGDMFLIRMPFGFQPEGPLMRNQFVHGTNHRARLRVITNDLTYIRGPLRHRPTGRRPDHRTLHLGLLRWWLCVKNTVPVTR